MQANFWHDRWANDEIGFHEPFVNPLLIRHLHHLGTERHGRVFVPLCGKTRDINWLLDGGNRVAAVELSELAVEQLFGELRLTPTITHTSNLRLYQARNIDVFVGNLFDVSDAMLGSVDAVYDRAALVALPEEMRARYAMHLTHITAAAPQLLICYEYDQRSMSGPPFSVSREHLCQYYGDRFDVLPLERRFGKLKGQDVDEVVWMLRGQEAKHDSDFLRGLV